MSLNEPHLQRWRRLCQPVPPTERGLLALQIDTWVIRAQFACGQDPACVARVHAIMDASHALLRRYGALGPQGRGAVVGLVRFVTGGDAAGDAASQAHVLAVDAALVDHVLARFAADLPPVGAGA